MRPLCASLAILLALAIGPVSANAQEFAELDVGQPGTAIARLGPPLAQQMVDGYVATKWARPNGLELSVTAVPGGPIVYMESFPGPYAPPIPGEGLRFKVTTMGQAIAMLGGPGFYYQGRGQSAFTGQDDVWFHSYALADRPNVIVTFAFIAPASTRRYGPDGSLQPNMEALLDSVIVADYAYQTQIWGGPALARPGYRPINLNYR